MALYQTLSFCVFLQTFLSCGWAQNSNIEYTFVEEQPPNTEIGNLTVDLGLTLKIAPEFYKDIKFQFLEQSNAYKPYFNIQNGTGWY